MMLTQQMKVITELERMNSSLIDVVKQLADIVDKQFYLLCLHIDIDELEAIMQDINGVSGKLAREREEDLCHR